MTIIDDILTFEIADLQIFSATVQAAIQFRAGVQPPEQYLSLRFNAVIAESVLVEKNARLENAENQTVALAFSTATTLTQNNVKALLGVA